MGVLRLKFLALTIGTLWYRAAADEGLEGWKNMSINNNNIIINNNNKNYENQSLAVVVWNNEGEEEEDYYHYLGDTCASIPDCGNCSNTYTCHWCDFDQACHARGSVHGCFYGSSCSKKKPDPKENNTCASRSTCADCALSSHFCHWCEHDNACHAIGSPYGCASGVDCYSNDRCRRKESEALPGWVIRDVPSLGLIVTLAVGALLLTCLSLCHFCFFNVKGAYDDLATITMTAASAAPPMSEIGGGGGGTLGGQTEFYNTLETQPEEGTQYHDGEGTTEDEASSSPESRPRDEESPPQVAATPGATNEASETDPTTSTQAEDLGQLQELESDPNALLNNTEADLMTPLLPPSSTVSFNGIPGMEEPRHMKSLYCMCRCLYYLAVLTVLSQVFLTLYFFPKKPVYNVCNDAIAWKQIIEKMATMQLDVGFEILISVSNPNRVTVALDQAKGGFAFEGQQIGTYTIPPAVAQARAITDVMLIAKVTPDKGQSVKLLEAYYRGKLVLQADFQAKVRAPAVFDVTYNVHLKDIDVYVNELGPRDLCQCPSWTNTNHPFQADSTSLELV